MLELNSLENIFEQNEFTKEYYYLAYLFDKVIFGRENDLGYSMLMKAAKEGQVLEIHLFNGEKEVFASRKGEEYVVYDPLFHEKPEVNNNVITRYYKLIQGLQDSSNSKYDTLTVKEYISYDEKSYMAYVEKTVLCALD